MRRVQAPAQLPPVAGRGAARARRYPGKVTNPSATQAVPTGRGAAAVACGVAAVEGAALIGNGLAVAVVVLRDGITGPSAVASPIGVAVEVVLYLLFGGALLWIARGLLRGVSAVLTPFLLAQLLGLTVSIPMAQGAGLAGVVGWIATGLAVAGIVAWWLLLRSRSAGEGQVQ